MKLAEVGTGYVGLVIGVTLSEIGHHVTCIDIDETKIEKMRRGISPIYEPGLSELMKENIEAGRLAFTSNHEEGFNEADVIYIAVGTPKNEDGSDNLTFVEEVATTIALTAKKDTIVVTKSTVPVGTNDRLQQIIDHKKLYHINIEVVSNPEFFKAGIGHGGLCFLKDTKALIQIACNIEYGFEILNDIVIKNNKYFSVIRRLKPHFQVSLESW